MDTPEHTDNYLPDVEPKKDSSNWRIFFKILVVANLLAIVFPIITLTYGDGIGWLAWLVSGGTLGAGAVAITNILTISYYLIFRNREITAFIAGILIILVSLPVAIYSGYWFHKSVIARQQLSELQDKSQGEIDRKLLSPSIKEASDLLNQCLVLEYYDRLDDYSPDIFKDQEPSKTGVYIVSLGEVDSSYLMYANSTASKTLKPLATQSNQSCGDPIINGNYE
jgi:hypothetical protein